MNESLKLLIDAINPHTTTVYQKLIDSCASTLQQWHTDNPEDAAVIQEILATYNINPLSNMETLVQQLHDHNNPLRYPKSENIAPLLQKIQAQAVQKNLHCDLLQIFETHNNAFIQKITDLLSHITAEELNTSYDTLTPLEIACKFGNLDIVKLLILHGADINYNDARCTLYALGRQHIDIAAFLVDQGADIGITDERGEELLTHACWNYLWDSAKFLVERGANPNTIDHNSVLFLSYFRGRNIEFMQFLLENGANPNLKDSGYGNCLFNRWLNEYLGEDNDYNNTRNLKALTLLLKHGFDINDALNTIAYHLHEESDSNNSKISDLVSLLIDEYRADIDLACSRGYTPLQVAANKGYTKMMQIFLDHGANVKNVVHNLCKALSNHDNYHNKEEFAALEFLVRSKEYTTSQDVNDMTPLISIFKPFEKVTFYGTPVIPLLTHATILIANGARIDHPDIILSIAKIPAGSLTLEFRGALYKNIKIYQYHDEILNLCGNQAQKDAIENLLKDIAACQYYAEALADSNFHNLPHVVMDSYLKPAKDGEVSSLQTLCAREIIKQPEKYFDMLLLSVENQEVPLISEIGFESLD